VVTDNDGMLRGSFGVELVGSDAMHDLAVLRIVPEDEMEIQSLLPIKMGSSSDLQVSY
jgi:S1-C subfamily serine protease